MIQGLIMLAMSYFAWFEIAKKPEEDSARGFVMIWKKIFGLKGYVLTAKIIAIFLFIGAINFLVQAIFGFSFIEAPE